MSAPVRFLAIVVIGWTGVRAMTLGSVPGFTASFAREVPPSGVAPIVPTSFPPLPPPDAAGAWAAQDWAGRYPQAAPPLPRPVYYPGYPYPYAYPYAAGPRPADIPPRKPWHLPSGGPGGNVSYSPLDPLGSWSMASLSALPEQQSRPRSFPAQPAVRSSMDRVQLTSWALVRGTSVPDSLAAGGTLGGSQAGARLTYNFNRWIAASLRTTTPIGETYGGEAAAGVRVTPFRSIPVAITAERRQSIGHGGGRSAFALFAEGGLYRRPMPLDFSLDAYVQAGIVGLNSRDLFADGAFAFTRPLWGRVSGGLGMWGGVQPGLYRIDAGPRLSLRIRDNVYAHLDWRQRLAGSARPDSGPALTLAADF